MGASSRHAKSVRLSVATTPKRLVKVDNHLILDENAKSDHKRCEKGQAISIPRSLIQESTPEGILFRLV
jgi:hypothetical protein